jgi:hypothetical protein
MINITALTQYNAYKGSAVNAREIEKNLASKGWVFRHSSELETALKPRKKGKCRLEAQSRVSGWDG